MFREKYKRAYAKVAPEEKLLNKMLEIAVEEENLCSVKPVLTFVAGVLTVVTLLSLTAVPVLAKNVPAVYRFLEGISPTVADWFVPIEESCTRSGITMEVEAVYVQDNRAEVYVSFCDAEGYMEDLIHGQVDLSGVCGMVNVSAKSVLGGCSYVGYEEETGKAYFKVTTETDTAYETDKMTFFVSELFCNMTKEEKPIDLMETVTEADVKSVTLSGAGGSGWEQIKEMMKQAESGVNGKVEAIDNLPDDPRPNWTVLQMKPVSECAADDFTITGIACLDGILRVQICMGDNCHADRHVQPFLVDSAGNERHHDASVSWHEEYQEVRYQFYEFYFTGDFAHLEDYNMYGIFHDTAESVQGDWSVTFRLE